MDTTAGWKRHDYKRACDICGHEWKRSRMRSIGQGRLACPDDYRGLTEQQIAKHNASVPPLQVKAHKNILLPAETGVYLLTEATLFDAVCKYGATAAVVGPTGGTMPAGFTLANGEGFTRTVASVAWSGIYLASVVEENERPTGWINRAKAALLLAKDFLLVRQYGADTGTPEATTSARYGGVLDIDTLMRASSSGLSGLVFLACYRIFGDASYLAAADRVAQFLRHAQRADARTTTYTTGTPGGTDRKFYGGFLSLDTSKVTQATLYTESALCLKFLGELKAIRGGSYQYGETAFGADYVSSTLGSIDEMITAARAFYVDPGVAEIGSSTPIAGLSAATPRNFWSCPLSNGEGDGEWSNATSVSTSNVVEGERFAAALYGLHGFEGASEDVLAIYEWLMGGADEAEEYDPEMALGTFLDPTSAEAGDDGDGQPGEYILGTAGLLAGVRVPSSRTLLAIKERLVRPVRAAIAGRPNVPLGPRGQCRFADFALPSRQQTTIYIDVKGCAQLGLAYRQAPQANSSVRAPS